MFREKSVADRKIVLSLLIAAMVLFCSIGYLVEAKPLGVWETHRYSGTIPQGCLLYHQYRHEGASSGSSRLISSTGSATLAYIWQAPWLFTYINNNDNKEIFVVWEEYFYVD